MDARNRLTIRAMGSRRHARDGKTDLARSLRSSRRSPISAVDLFCGAGGLTHGLLRAGIKVEAGIDIDVKTGFAFEANNPGARFLPWDIDGKNAQEIGRLFGPGRFRLLAGCAPCQPFSKLTNGIARHRAWDLLNNFGRFVSDLEPELVTMENVPELANRGLHVFKAFLGTLERVGYWIDWKLVQCANYGVPQLRRRLVLLASKLGPIEVPAGHLEGKEAWSTVRDSIGALPMLRDGEQDPRDRIHVASRLSHLNIRRLQATPADGGSRNAWPDDLELACHRKKSGRKYVSIYGRMAWERPAPTMTTLCNGIGNGRFGHPEQDRAISLREAALIQSFPRTYRFWPPEEKLSRKSVARMIGNAVPPALAAALGKTLIAHVKKYGQAALG